MARILNQHQLPSHRAQGAGLGWSYTKLIAELRRQAAIDGVLLPRTESRIRLISRWGNNHQQPDDFFRDLLGRATGRHRFELFSDEAAVALLAARTNAGIAPIVAVGWRPADSGKAGGRGLPKTDAMRLA